MLELLLRLNHDQGVTVVMATHGVDLVPLFLDRLCILDRGRVALDGTPGEVFTSPDALAAVRLRFPYVAELAWRLKHEERLPLGGIPLTVEDALGAIASLVQDQKRTGGCRD